ncbi:ACP S-malonyltransferase [Tumebacillus permanentifrigoris]|uniref:[acyl-carrier-protein] S-malonyltransferase n=1 Tax=Tumebacillus permanentifrigoris TaxID=378543 RepID=A0A316D4H2_9BACL|nr:ACP S-malonyltransferase [Tumebacillus permanentifrigoris]PWK05377.1 [acyl-carrier-protein] S-malonyltransferase [Tumebacillus permanentifrigoris]
MEKIAFLFTGQGAQYVGMAKSFYDEHAIAKQTFEEANDVLGFDLARLCFEGGLGELTRTENTQPALLTASVAAFRVYMQEIGIAPQFCAGHSMGEYAALTCAGAIRYSDALKIVRQRGLYTKEIADSEIGGMTIIDGLPVEVVEEEARKMAAEGKYVVVNCYNSPTQTAIAGDAEAVEELESRLLDLDGQVTPLLMSAPFHTKLMSPVAEKLKELLQTIEFNHFRYPVIANIDGQPYGDPANIVEKLTQQTVRPVRWQETMQFLQRFGVTHAIEMGPKNVLCNLVTANTPSIEALCFAAREDRKALHEIFSPTHPLKKHIPTVVTRCLAIAVATPNKNNDKDAYREGVIEPYRKIQQLQDELDQEQAQPTEAQMREALQMLASVFATKGVPVAEQRDWFYQILDETGTYYLFNDLVFSNLQTV